MSCSEDQTTAESTELKEALRKIASLEKTNAIQRKAIADLIDSLGKVLEDK